ncbi:MAG: aminoacyl-tRNA hydrolase [Actinobacteria bacterium 13_1_20CM_3_71_11]|nr:MAG: aminoacyl-tRNA hydrolase [Actinobacteria bacterium 13_1_20CM_3_71_11]
MEGYLQVTSAVAIPRAELSWRFSRGSGPGGQSVNTSDSRVELRFDLAGTAALPEPLKERALTRLADRLVDGVVAALAAALAPPARTRRPTRPSRSAVQRRLDTKRHRGQTKRLRGSTDD